MTETINKLNMAIHVLNHIDTCGKQNLLNLGGAIDLLENVVAGSRKGRRTGRRGISLAEKYWR